jgi:hypothetical protein
MRTVALFLIGLFWASTAIAQCPLVPTSCPSPVFNALQVTGGTTLTNPVSTPTLTLSGNNAVLSNTHPTAWVNMTGFVGGTVSGATVPNILNMIVNDKVISSTSQVFNVVNIEDIIAPNGNIAQGNRVVFNTLLQMIGTSQDGGGGDTTGSIVGNVLTVANGANFKAGRYISGIGIPVGTTLVSGGGTSWIISATLGTVPATGTEAMSTTNYLNTGNGQAVNFASQAASNEGGTSTFYSGIHTTVDTYCEILTGATYMGGAACEESDMLAQSGTQILRNTQILYVHLTGNNQLGWLGPDLGAVFAEQSDSNTAIGYKQIFSLGSNAAGFPSQANGAILYAYTGSVTNPSTLATGIDTANVNYTGCINRSPFTKTCNLQAGPITGATLLTTDGSGVATSFVYQVDLTNRGSLLTFQPTASIPLCTGAVVNGSINIVTGQVVDFGVNNRGSACKAEATMTVAAQNGGTAAAGQLLIEGNSLNFPPNTGVTVNCQVTANGTVSGTQYTIGWTNTFSASMGANSASTVVPPSQTWTQAQGATSGAPSFISIAAPTANTTLGAINTIITPTSGTWSVGGSCTMTSPAQII